MRKQLKVQLVEILGSLAEAADYLITHEQDIEGLRGDCFLCIQTVKENVKEITDAFLLAGEIEREIDQNNFANVLNKVKQLVKLVQETADTYEIVFMPYKADMWDAFDSVYRAAKMDENVNVKVIPVPYYLVGNIGKKDSLKYEGDRFPDDVEITSYTKYNFEVNHPDVIFIHNPYDKFNNVTRLPEQFHSDQLIRYTDKLVYIPYYVCIEGENPSNEIQFQLPAVLRSWKTFVQSEKIRSAYLMNKHLKPEQIVAMGSPKLDAVVNYELKEEDIPKEWKQKIRGRKVIFFNSHLDNILNASEELLKSLRKLYDLVASNQEIVLLWRPHPLSDETFQSADANNYEEYKRIVEEYKKLENCIYDDSSDLQRAIYISDAYYGDYSSVAPLYAATGKPIMINQPLRFKKNEIVKIPFIAGATYQDDIYFSAWEFNGLFKISKKTREISYVLEFPDESYDKSEMYLEARVYKDSCYFIPQSGKYIAKVDLISNQVKKINIPKECRILKPGFKTSDVIKMDHILWIIPSNMDAILKLNMEDDSIQVFKDWPGNYDFNHVNFISGARLGSHLYLCPYESEYLVEFDMNTGSMKQLPMKFKKNHFAGIVSDGESLWFAPKAENYILKYNFETGIEKIPIPVEETPVQFSYSNIYYRSGCLWLLSWSASYLLKVDVKTNEITKIPYLDKVEFGISDREYADFFKLVDDEEEVYLPSGYGNELIKISDDTVSVDKLEINRSKMTFKGRGNYLGGDTLLRHVLTNVFYSAEQFFEDVSKEKNFNTDKVIEDLKEEIDHVDGTSGTQIWKYVKEYLN